MTAPYVHTGKQVLRASEHVCDASDPETAAMIVEALNGTVAPLDVDPLEAVVRPIVEGQLLSFLHDHPSVLDAVDWYKKRDDRALTFINSIAKRIVGDLLCAETRVRLVSALVARTTAEPIDGERGICTCAAAGGGGTTTAPASHAAAPVTA
jgi:phosphoribosylaminoimidazole-succinocarboxamide synthase